MTSRTSLAMRRQLPRRPSRTISVCFRVVSPSPVCRSDSRQQVELIGIERAPQLHPREGNGRIFEAPALDQLTGARQVRRAGPLKQVTSVRVREVGQRQRRELLEAQRRVVFLDIAAGIPVLHLQRRAALEMRRRIDRDRAIATVQKAGEEMRRLENFAGTRKHDTRFLERGGAARAQRRERRRGVQRVAPRAGSSKLAKGMCPASIGPQSSAMAP